MSGWSGASGGGRVPDAWKWKEHPHGVQMHDEEASPRREAKKHKLRKEKRRRSRHRGRLDDFSLDDDASVSSDAFDSPRLVGDTAAGLRASTQPRSILKKPATPVTPVTQAKRMSVPLQASASGAAPTLLSPVAPHSMASLRRQSLHAAHAQQAAAPVEEKRVVQLTQLGSGYTLSGRGDNYLGTSVNVRYGLVALPSLQGNMLSIRVVRTPDSAAGAGDVLVTVNQQVLPVPAPARRVPPAWYRGRTPILAAAHGGSVFAWALTLRGDGAELETSFTVEQPHAMAVHGLAWNPFSPVLASYSNDAVMLHAFDPPEHGGAVTAVAQLMFTVEASQGQMIRHCVWNRAGDTLVVAYHSKLSVYRWNREWLLGDTADDDPGFVAFDVPASLRCVHMLGEKKKKKKKKKEEEATAAQDVLLAATEDGHVQIRASAGDVGMDAVQTTYRDGSTERHREDTGGDIIDLTGSPGQSKSPSLLFNLDALRRREADEQERRQVSGDACATLHVMRIGSDRAVQSGSLKLPRMACADMLCADAAGQVLLVGSSGGLAVHVVQVTGVAPQLVRTVTIPAEDMLLRGLHPRWLLLGTRPRGGEVVASGRAEPCALTLCRTGDMVPLQPSNAAPIASPALSPAVVPTASSPYLTSPAAPRTPSMLEATVHQAPSSSPYAAPSPAAAADAVQWQLEAERRALEAERTQLEQDTRASLEAEAMRLREERERVQQQRLQLLSQHHPDKGAKPSAAELREREELAREQRLLEEERKTLARVQRADKLKRKRAEEERRKKEQRELARALKEQKQAEERAARERAKEEARLAAQLLAEQERAAREREEAVRALREEEERVALEQARVLEYERIQMERERVALERAKIEFMVAEAQARSPQLAPTTPNKEAEPARVVVEVSPGPGLRVASPRRSSTPSPPARPPMVEVDTELHRAARSSAYRPKTPEELRRMSVRERIEDLRERRKSIDEDNSLGWAELDDLRDRRRRASVAAAAAAEHAHTPPPVRRVSRAAEEGDSRRVSFPAAAEQDVDDSREASPAPSRRRSSSSHHRRKSSGSRRASLHRSGGKSPGSRRSSLPRTSDIRWDDEDDWSDANDIDSEWIEREKQAMLERERELERRELALREREQLLDDMDREHSQRRESQLQQAPAPSHSERSDASEAALQPLQVEEDESTVPLGKEVLLPVVHEEILPATPKATQPARSGRESGEYLEQPPMHRREGSGRDEEAAESSAAELAEELEELAVEEVEPDEASKQAARAVDDDKAARARRKARKKLSRYQPRATPRGREVKAQARMRADKVRRADQQWNHVLTQLMSPHFTEHEQLDALSSLASSRDEDERGAFEHEVSRVLHRMQTGVLGLITAIDSRTEESAATIREQQDRIVKLEKLLLLSLENRGALPPSLSGDGAKPLASANHSGGDESKGVVAPPPAEANGKARDF